MSHECQILRSSGSLLNVFVSSLYFMIQRLKLLLLESARPDIDRLSLNLFLCCFRLPAACLRNIFVPRSLRVEGTFLLYFKRRTVIDSCKVCLFFVNDIYISFFSSSSPSHSQISTSVFVDSSTPRCLPWIYINAPVQARGGGSVEASGKP